MLGHTDEIRGLRFKLSGQRSIPECPVIVPPGGLDVRSSELGLVCNGGERVRRDTGPGGSDRCVAGGGDRSKSVSDLGVCGNGNRSPTTPPTSGPATSSELSLPYGDAVDAQGNVYIGDLSNGMVEKVTSTGELSVIAGDGGFGSITPGRATSTTLPAPAGVAVRGDGRHVADVGASQVYKISQAGMLSIVAGTGSPGPPTLGPATASELKQPYAVAVNAGGDVYIADYANNVVEKVTPSGLLSVVAGTGAPLGIGPGVPPIDGPATSADLRRPDGLAIDSSGNLYIADSFNNVIEKVSPSGMLSVIAGTGTPGLPTPGRATSSDLGQSGGPVVGCGRKRLRRRRRQQRHRTDHAVWDPVGDRRGQRHKRRRPDLRRFGDGIRPRPPRGGREHAGGTALRRRCQQQHDRSPGATRAGQHDPAIDTRDGRGRSDLDRIRRVLDAESDHLLLSVAGLRRCRHQVRRHPGGDGQRLHAGGPRGGPHRPRGRYGENGAGQPPLPRWSPPSISDAPTTGTTPPGITATTVAGTDKTTASRKVRGQSAALGGLVAANAGRVSYRFQYGPTGRYGATSAAGTLAASTIARAVTTTVRGLLPGSVYHYRLVVTGAAGAVSYGGDKTLTTPRVKPRRVRDHISPYADRYAPYEYRVHGRMVLPRGLSHAEGCRTRGTATITATVAHKVIARRRVNVSTACTYTAAFRLTAAQLPGSGRASFHMRYAGNDQLRGRQARTLIVLYGPNAK